MGWRFQRRIRVAPGVHLNVSKSGYSWSFGGSPYTVNVGPRGTYQTFSIPGTGFSHRQRSDGRAKRRSQAPTPSDEEVVSQVKVEETSADDLIRAVNERTKRFGAFVPVLLVTILLAFVNPVWLLIGAYPCYLAHRRDLRVRTTEIVYALDAEKEARYAALREGFDALARSNRIWLILGDAYHGDWKRNAGAVSSITRRPVVAGVRSPRYIRTNIDVGAIKLGRQTLFFFPDRLVVEEGRRYSSFAYENLRVDASEVLFVETKPVPLDGTIASQTWQYVRKDGGPDRRFAANRQLPVMNYGVLEFFAGETIRIVMHVSRLAAPEEFVARFREFQGARTKGDARAGADRRSQKGTSRRDSSARRDPPPTPPDTSATSSPWQTLGVHPGASPEQIAAAYRAKAKLYHPDKVANLGPELRDLAEKKMREINGAYDELRAQQAGR